MQRIKRYTLGKKERLKSRKVIEQLFKQGSSFSIFPFRVLWLYQLQQDVPLQAGFTVSSKSFKKAVDRNLIRRLMKEAYRLQKNALQQSLISSGRPAAIFIIYTGKELPKQPMIFEKMALVLQRLQNKNNENASANS